MIVPDKWKDGARNVTEGGGRKINENKLLSKKNRYVSPSTVLCFRNVEVVMEIALNLLVLRLFVFSFYCFVTCSFF